MATSAPSQPAPASRTRSSSPRTPPPASSVSPGTASRTRAISSRSSPASPADARQVDHDHRRLRRRRRREPPARAPARAERQRVAADGDNRLAFAQVETERHPVSAHRRADRRQRVERGERLETDDHTRGAEVERVAGAIDGRHARVEPERRAKRRQRGGERVLRYAAQDRVEIGRVQLGEAEAARVRARERQGVAGLNGRSGDRAARAGSARAGRRGRARRGRPGDRGRL